jgi:hypothetical protein
MANDARFSKCLARVAARGSLGEKEAMDIIAEVAERADTMRQTGQLDPHVYAAADLAATLVQRREAALLDALQNTRKINNAVAPILAAGSIKGAAKRVFSLFFWQPGAADNRNIQTLAANRTHTWSSLLWSELHQAGALKSATLAKNWRDIANEIGRLKDPAWGRATGNAKAEKIAKLWSPIAEDIRGSQNAEGAKIGNATDYAGNTAHDPFLLRRGGRGIDRIKDAEAAFQAWWGFVKGRLDDKTYDELHADVEPRPPESWDAAKERFGRAVWEALVTGVRKPEPREPGTISFGSTFQGSANLARKLSEGRVLFWKNADAWTDYMERYGKPTNFYDMAIRHIEASGKTNAMMHFLGTNPQANLQTILDRVQRHYRSDVDGLQQFQKELKGGWTGPNLEAIMAHLDGSANVPSNEMWATIGNTTRQFYDMEFLGSVSITHATSTLATIPTAARFYGIGGPTGTLHALASLMKSMVPEALRGADRDELLRQMGSYGAGASRKAFNAFGHGWNFPGVVSALHDKYMFATGIHYWLEHAQNGFKEMVANHLAANAGKELSQLEPHLQNTLGQYGIGKEEWDLLRKTQMLQAGSRTYMTPKQALSLDRDTVKTLLMQKGQLAANATAEQIDKAVGVYRQNLADNMGMFLEDAGRTSTVTSGLRERAVLRDLSKPGSPTRELWAMATQFKAWPVAALHQMLGRNVYEAVGQNWLGARGADAAKGVLTLIGLSMLGGYVRMTAGDLVSTRQPREPRNLGETTKIALASLAQGGGLGIFGDYLFGEANRFGSSFGATAGGPLAQDAEQLVGIYNRWLQGLGTEKAHDFWPDLANWGIHHVPMQNLFYIKALMDYGLWYHVTEAIHPGWWQRTNQRMQKEQGRTLMGYRPGQRGYSGVPFTPFG